MGRIMFQIRQEDSLRLSSLHGRINFVKIYQRRCLFRNAPTWIKGGKFNFRLWAMPEKCSCFRASSPYLLMIWSDLLFLSIIRLSWFLWEAIFRRRERERRKKSRWITKMRSCGKINRKILFAIQNSCCLFARKK